jgi:hypothetical protein
MANVNLDAGKGNFTEHDPAVDRLDDGMEQTVEKFVISALLFYHVDYSLA